VAKEAADEVVFAAGPDPTTAADIPENVHAISFIKDDAVKSSL
jgi:hypothetical protein